MSAVQRKIQWEEEMVARDYKDMQLKMKKKETSQSPNIRKSVKVRKDRSIDNRDILNVEDDFNHDLAMTASVQ